MKPLEHLAKALNLSQDHLKPSPSYEASYETLFALVLFDSPHSESKVKQKCVSYEAPLTRKTRL